MLDPSTAADPRIEGDADATPPKRTLLRTTRSILTFLTQEAFTALTLLVAFVATPSILRWLGDERFGAFESLMSWSASVSLLDLGITDALFPLFTRAFGIGDREATKRLFAASVRAYLKVAALMIVVSLGVWPFISKLVPVSQSYAGDLRWAWLVGLSLIPLLPLSGFLVLAQSEQRGYWINSLLIGQSLVITAFSLLFAWAGWGITGQALAVVPGAIAFNLLLTARGLRDRPGLLSRTVLREPIDDQAQREISRLRWPSLLFAVCGRVCTLSNNIIIALVMSPAAVVPFFVTLRLNTIAVRELTAIGGSSWAALAELQAQGKFDLFNLRLVELTRLVAILAVAGLVPIVAYNHYFVALWVGRSRYGGDMLTTISCVNVVLFAVFALWSWSVTATGHVRDLMVGTIAQTIINVSSSIVFTIKFGIVGPVLGTLVSFLTVSIWYFPYVLRRRFGTLPRELFMALLMPLMVGVPYAAFVLWFSSAFSAANWFTIAWQMIAMTLLYIVIATMALLSRSERALWVQRVRLTLTREPG
jgi:O-antigen/teichoic acid export membrane protein